MVLSRDQEAEVSGRKIYSFSIYIWSIWGVQYMSPVFLSWLQTNWEMSIKRDKWRGTVTVITKKCQFGEWWAWTPNRLITWIPALGRVGVVGGACSHSVRMLRDTPQPTGIHPPHMYILYGGDGGSFVPAEQLETPLHNLAGKIVTLLSILWIE